MSDYFYLDANRERQGPVGIDALKEMTADGRLRPNDLIWTEDWADWQEARTLAGLFESAAQAAPAAAAAPRGATQKAPGPWSIPAMPPAGYTPSTFGKLFNWWLWLLIGGIVGLIVGVLTVAVVVGIPILIVSVPAYFAAIVLWYIMLYKWWRQIQDGHARTGPGKAVGFMFIPFFNWYWMFVAIYGLAVDLGAYLDRYGVRAQKPSAGLALTMCILWICSIIPILGYLALLAAFVILFIVFTQFSRASQAIAAHLGNLCTQCGYPIGDGGTCPECGAPTPPRQP